METLEDSMDLFPNLFVIYVSFHMYPTKAEQNVIYFLLNEYLSNGCAKNRMLMC
jgi:hypothetical protein